MIEFFGTHPDDKEFVVCLGFFDGVHLGHMRLLEAAREIKRREGLFVCVHTYSVAPTALIHPDRIYKELTPLDEKISLLLKNGADMVAVSHFDEKLMRMDATQFIDQELGGQFRVKHLVVGSDHRFGFHARTGAAELQALCAKRGIGLTVVAPVKTPDGDVISSTAIKTALSNGNRKVAEAMLGRSIKQSLSDRFRAE